MTSSSVIPTQRTEPDMHAWSLMTAAQQGDREAFGQLYERYVDVVFPFVLYRVADRPLAEDITSDTFLRALRRLDSVTFQGRDLGAWFVTIARNLIIDHRKRSRSRLESPTGELPVQVDGSPGPDQEAINSVTTAAVLAALERLTDEQRDAVTMRHLLGMSVLESAAALGCSPEALKARTHRGMIALAGVPELRELGAAQ